MTWWDGVVALATAPFVLLLAGLLLAMTVASWRGWL